MTSLKISVLPGDGIGREVIPEAVRVIQSAIEAVDGIELEFNEFECGGEYYLRAQREWSLEAEEFTKGEADATLLGAVGALGPNDELVRLPDGNMAGYSLALGLRFGLDLYANVRPVQLYEGVPTPLVGRESKDIQMLIVRENTEGLYAPTRGVLKRGKKSELAVDTRIITRRGAERVVRYAFEAAKGRKGAPSDEKSRVTCVDKSNLLAGCQLFRMAFDEIGEEYPDIERDYAFVDAFAQWIVKKPQYYDVVVTPNEFGDILTDLGAALQGGLGMAPAGNIGDEHAVFEPVHGSAPKYYGKKMANPIAAILAGAMMLEWLSVKHNQNRLYDARTIIRTAVKRVLSEGRVRTYDLCLGKWAHITPSSTPQVADALIREIRTMT